MSRTNFGRRMFKGKRRHEHIIIAMKILNRELKPGEMVHHVDYDQNNNDRSNLVICPNMAYHALLHLRTDALDACGNANYRRCLICKKYDDPNKMTNYRYTSINGGYRHHACTPPSGTELRAARAMRGFSV